MALRRRPHSFTLLPVTETHTGGRVDAPAEGTGRIIKCQITPMATDAVLRTFVPDIELKQPHLMLCDPADGEGITVGDRGVFGGRRFRVSAPIMSWGAGSATDHCQILLDAEQYS